MLTNKIQVVDKLLEMQKQYIYEKNMRSKIIVVYAIEKEAQEIDLHLTKIKMPTFQYFSFKHSSSEERITAMHANKLINVKARYEMLFNVNLELNVKYENNKKNIG